MHSELTSVVSSALLLPGTDYRQTPTDSTPFAGLLDPLPQTVPVLGVFTCMAS